MDISPAGRAIAKIFWNGRSQAVRLPREFRFDTDEVLVWREGNRIVLEPAQKRGWPSGYFETLDALGPLDESVTPPPSLPPSSYRDEILDAWHRGDDHSENSGNER
jgi:antitoxin VapB